MSCQESATVRKCPKLLIPPWTPPTVNFACPVRLCTLKDSLCVQISAPGKPDGKWKEIGGSTMSQSPWTKYWVFLFVFNGIKISFCCSRLFSVLMFLNVPAANWDIKEEFYHLIPTVFSKILPCWMKDTMILAQSHSHVKNRLPAVRFTGINFSDVIFFFPQCYPPCSSSM